MSGTGQIGRFVWNKVSEMARNAIDRRSARTRASLQDALMALILRKGYDALTIDEICAAADVGRSSFYAHYANKDDLKRSGFEHLRRRLIDRQCQARVGSTEPTGESLVFTLPLLEHARDHLQHYRALKSGRGGLVALGALRDLLFDLVRSELPGRGTARHEIAVRYVTGGLMTVLTWWLDNGAKLPPQEIDDIVRAIVRNGMAALQASPESAAVERHSTSGGR